MIIRIILFLGLLSLSGQVFGQSYHVKPSNNYYVHAKSGLNMREAPDSKSKVIGSLPYGTQVKGIEPAGERFFVKDFNGYEIHESWYKVEVGGKTGYVFKGYLSQLPPFKDVQGLSGYLSENFTLAYTTTYIYYDEGNPDKACNRLEYYKEGITQRIHSCSDETWDFVLTFPNRTMAEVALLARMMLEKDGGTMPLMIEYDQETNQIHMEKDISFVTIAHFGFNGVVLVVSYG